MPDMLLPQVPSAPAAAKPAPSAPRSAEAKPETQLDQDFSDVLKAQMEPEKATGQVNAEAQGAAVESAAGEPPVETADGNPLPQGGNAPVPVFAALDPLLQGTEAVAELEAGTVDISVETVALMPGLPGETLPDAPAQTNAGATRQQPLVADAWQLRGGPWKAGAAELPEAAQTAVAQAVRSAVAEFDENMQLLEMNNFGAEVRAATTAQSRMPGLDAMFDRLTATAAQPAVPSGGSAVQGMQTLVPQDAAAARPALPTTTVETPLRQPGWDQALSERVMWVANQKFQGAEIKLNPAHLGPIEVRVQLHQDQAQISFTAQHPSAREALEAALPRLRDMFSASGYNLVDVNVSQHSFAEQQRHAQGFGGHFQGAAQHEEDVESVSGPLPRTGSLAGLPSSAIDLFA